MSWSKLSIAALTTLFPLGLNAATTCDALSLDDQQSLQTYIQQTLGKPSQCGSSLAQGGAASEFCFASFDFRSADAAEAFVELDQQLSACFDRSAVKGAGHIVNHPDSFDQLKFCATDTQIGLSLKDKGGLAKTLVFLTTTKLNPLENACF